MSGALPTHSDFSSSTLVTHILSNLSSLKTFLLQLLIGEHPHFMARDLNSGAGRLSTSWMITPLSQLFPVVVRGLPSLRLALRIRRVLSCTGNTGHRDTTQRQPPRTHSKCSSWGGSLAHMWAISPVLFYNP